MKINHLSLAKSCDFDPEKIGIAILKMLGYRVDTFLFLRSVYVYKGEKLIYYRDTV